MSDDPFLESPPNVPPGERKDTDYSPSSDREVGELQDDQAGSPALDDPDIDRDAVKVLPGTGDYTDDGQVDVDPEDVHIPRHPDADGVGPVADHAAPDGGQR
ncbi:hypothetical protein [Amnibacterium sp.]|uniref:hypothetical protein n=1 Tax=Amnibacterium sp. TaxID=1872496 RepID=UPI002627606D|nr:hypothetical protein [Amnibacterium sp.]MCU1475213.1 hypothetical protein [Amnibacterium sp.]